jgi:hypothetical protein
MDTPTAKLALATDSNRLPTRRHRSQSFDGRFPLLQLRIGPAEGSQFRATRIDTSGEAAGNVIILRRVVKRSVAEGKICLQ